MDRLPFASEVVLSEVADMYPASHDGVFFKRFSHSRTPSRREWRGAVLSSPKAELSLQQGTSLQTSHPAGVYPHHGPPFRDGRAPGGRHHSV